MTVPDGAAAGPVDDVRVVVARPGADSAALAGLRWAWAFEKGDVGGDPGVPDPGFVAEFARWVAANASSHTGFLAYDAVGGDGRAVGMAWLAAVERVPDVTRPVRRNGFVQTAYVLPERRDAGVGAALLAALVERARVLGLEYLLVSPSERSVPFYRRLGFDGDHRLSLRLR